ncbi:hypothetical protein BU24DRAFT_435773 [Aaosphaeria arxii CBS 175.79]|uniref:Alpha and gamma adaptin binding protein p34 n=1 Tax=Aaosphaeria arxii CBS 175.79 TaxID=1450172 RepID=A0A6A5XEB7_9PLEO|nr:uncharacterized protein BU24DRAFT_435773 [Aaosphaeria arxii CBS 175.79]KAF2011229.1 hypothetical protein BU24DRAFT_435773 [Aaosphaeria arxii CBS 175.79]
MEILNPRRILALGAPDAGVLTLLKELTGSTPSAVSNTIAGLTHDFPLTTKYYTATLPIWIDEIPSTTLWRDEFSKPEAREVVSALGAWIFCFRKPVSEEDVTAIRDVLSAIADVIEKAMGYAAGDQVCLAVAMPQSTTPYLEKSGEEWEEVCLEYGFEFVDFEKSGKNEFGEEMGVKRVRAALEANDWEGGGGAGSDDEGGLLSFDGEEGFDAEESEMGREFFGLRSALDASRHFDDDDGEEDGDEEGQVEELENMMRKMVAIKEMGEGMPEAERKRFAAKAVSDLMKDL